MTLSEWEEQNALNTLMDDEEAIDKREFLDEDGNDIYKKKSEDKSVEERIKTSRTLKIKHNKWNQVDYTEDNGDEKIVITPQYSQSSSSYENVEFEKKVHEIIKNSKYSTILLGDEKVTINYQVVNDIIIYLYGKLKNDYNLTRVFVFTCEYCGVSLMVMWKRLSSYLQMQILKELSEVSKLPIEFLENDIKMF